MSEPYHHPWSNGEIVILHVHYGISSSEPWTTKKIASILGRTVVQVRSTATRLGLRARLLHPGNRRLRAMMARGLGSRKIARVLGRKRATVAKWLQKLRSK